MLNFILTHIESVISFISLVIAFLAVFVSPLIQKYIAEKQMNASLKISMNHQEVSLKIAQKQIESPMRQAWIEEIRELLAKFIQSANICFQGGLTLAQQQPYRYELLYLRNKISLMLNLTENDHIDLDNKLREIIGLGFYNHVV